MPRGKTQDDRAPRVAENVVARTIAGETLLVPLEQDVAQCDRIFILNRTGTFLWERLDGHRDAGGLVALLREAFDIDDDELARRDVDAFLGAMDARGLIEWEAR